jgi:restriction system protein
MKFHELFRPLLSALSDGRELAELMVRYGVGVTPRQTYTLFNIDSDYFTEE